MVMMNNPQQHLGKVVDNGHCVRFLQVHANMPHTSTWKRGEKVLGNAIASGTIVATFNDEGRYTNETNGNSHAAVYLYQEDQGIWVIDQWQGQPVHQRLIRFGGLPVNNSNSYYVVEV